MMRPGVRRALSASASAAAASPLSLEFNKVSSTCRMVRAVDPHGPYSTPRIPVVDFGAFMGRAASQASSSREAEVVEAVKLAYSQGEGFMLVTGTGIDEALTKRVVRDAHRFFALDGATKDEFRTAKGELGYVVPTRDRHRIIQEYLNVGYPLGRSDSADAEIDADSYYSSDLGKLFFSHTEAGSYAGELAARWPAEATMQRGGGAGAAVRESSALYFSEMERFSDSIWDVFERALRLPAGSLLDISRRHISHLQLNHYPAQKHGPPDGGKMRIRAHFDVNAFTVLRNDETGRERGRGNLQVKTRDGEWRDMPVVPDTYIVNVGELVARWTNKQWHHVVHRVTNPVFDPVSAELDPSSVAPARVTLGFFAFPDYDAVVDCLPGFVPQRASDREYEPMTCGEHSRIGRRLGAHHYDPERLEQLRVQQGLYGKDELEF